MRGRRAAAALGRAAAAHPAARRSGAGAGRHVNGEGEPLQPSAARPPPMPPRAKAGPAPAGT
jgi:hypothetical protein